MAKMYKIFEDSCDPYPLAVSEADVLLLQHEGYIIDTDEWVEEGAGPTTYTGLITEGIASNSFLAKVPIEQIEKRLGHFEHVDAEFFIP